jgi:type III pantothenate kinase
MIAVDVGNSAIKLAWLRRDPQARTAEGSAVKLPLEGPHEIPLVMRFSLRDADWPAQLARYVIGRPWNEGYANEGNEHWFAASVNRPALRRLKELITDVFPQGHWRELTRLDIDLETDIRNPDTIGIDRLLGARAARNLSPTGTVISIDAGSAVTVDLVREGKLVGGAILPGIGLQLSVLSQATDRLPSVPVEQFGDAEIPGRDTVSAIRCGVFQGIAGGIDRLVDLYAAQLESPPVIVLTGGDAGTLQPILRHHVIRSDGLVTSGILDIAKQRLDDSNRVQ